MADLAAFDLLFQQADVDKDGKISGSEAIQFFKGANLPQPILAKIWHAADNGHTGFLSRPEFHNALKLVTVAQSGRELTPEIMRAALVGPASSKIPAPKIQVAPKQVGQPVQTLEQTSGAVQQVPVQQNLQQTIAPVSQVQQAATFSQPQPQPTVTSLSNLQAVQSQPPRSPLNNLQALYQSPGQQVPSHSAPRPVQRESVQGQLFSSAPIRPPVQTQGFVPAAQPPPNMMGTTGPVNSTGATRTSFSSGIEAGSKPGESPFGNDMFSAGSTTNSVPVTRSVPSTPRQPPPSPAPSPVPSPARSPMGGGQGFRPPVGVPAWPRMTAADVQRYSQVFANVDTDKDGKITGTQARDLFFSWKLPREVLKQVWDLSDQDGDSMLSFREFCTAVYLIERFREGRPLPPVLPVGFHFDDGSPQSLGNAQQPPGYNIPPWQRNPRMFQPGIAGMPGGFPSQHQNMTRNARNRKVSEPDNESAMPAAPTENKVLDSKEKLEFYRTKLQELVLFKKKCDNRLAEITDKAAAEKREEELMAKKYEEKYKQALDVNSRLVSEESAFREIQTLKVELRNAIAEIERGGNPNTLVQTRSDRIANDLDELEKALAQRGQFLGFQVNRTTVELPFGWQPGHQENAVEWDEDWDKFDDEGFSTLDGIMDEPQVSNRTTMPDWDDGLFADDTLESNGTQVNHAEELEEIVSSPRAESETSSLKSGIDSPQWSPNVHSAKKSPLGTSPLSTSDHRPDDTPASSSSFDPEPSFDGEKPWESAFGNDDMWGLQSDFPALSIQSPNPGSDVGSSFHSDFKNENDIFASSSVPSTPLFKSEPQPTFFTQDSRRDSFESSQGRTPSLYDDNDPFGDTGPFSQKSSRWGTF